MIVHKRNLEAKIQQYISTKGGLTEVKTPVGRIDVVYHHTKTIVEIKKIGNWKNAIGQLICYKESLPIFSDYKLHLLLFGEPTNKPYLYGEIKQNSYLQLKARCRKMGITFEFFSKDKLIALAFPRQVLLVL